jgi:F5/8 type C domain
MRKRLTNQASSSDESWLDLQRLAEVEFTSEDAAYPIEAALMPNATAGWRAAQAGEQTIRFLFDELQTLKRIRLAFQEDEQARTQEFVLRWSPDGRSYREIVRQQYNFSPPSGAREVEDYVVNLAGVKALELKIVPNTSGGDCRASLAELGIA